MSTGYILYFSYAIFSIFIELLRAQIEDDTNSTKTFTWIRIPSDNTFDNYETRDQKNTFTKIMLMCNKLSFL